MQPFKKSWDIGQNTVICRSYKAIYVLQKNIENIIFHSTENKFLNSFRISLFQHEEIFARWNTTLTDLANINVLFKQPV